MIVAIAWLSEWQHSAFISVDQRDASMSALTLCASQRGTEMPDQEHNLDPGARALRPLAYSHSWRDAAGISRLHGLGHRPINFEVAPPAATLLRDLRDRRASAVRQSPRPPFRLFLYASLAFTVSCNAWQMLDLQGASATLLSRPCCGPMAALRAIVG